MIASKDDLGDRMKAYEAIESQRRLDPLTPIAVRIDGRSFSKFTKGFQRPFDPRLTAAMQQTCQWLVEQTHARIGYVQSDEINLIFQAEEGQGMLFDARVQKLTSVLASMAAAKFNRVLGDAELASFDARVWQVPNQIEAANVLMWRAVDCRKNAVLSVARAHFPHSDLQGKPQTELLEMLASAGVDFAAYPARNRFGTFYGRRARIRRIDDTAWAKIPPANRPASREVARRAVEELPIDFLGDVRNRVAVIFSWAEPILASDRDT